jgi:hypothetical protein
MYWQLITLPGPVFGDLIFAENNANVLKSKMMVVSDM